jgi:hypothetical protein
VTDMSNIVKCLHRKGDWNKARVSLGKKGDKEQAREGWRCKCGLVALPKSNIPIDSQEPPHTGDAS